MFAVPGWNLSAPLKTESEAPAAAAAPAGGNPKKRKRQNKKGGGRDNGNNDAARNVTSENVADMWAEVVEGTKRSPSKEAGPPKMKSQKQEFKAAQRLEMQAKQRQENEGEGKKPKSKKQRREEDVSTAKNKEGEKKEKKKDDGAEEQGSSRLEAKGKKTKQKKNKDRQPDNTNTTNSTNTAAAAAPSPLPPANAKLTPLQAKMREKLASARFRHLNQTLYTTPSAHSQQLIDDDPQIFAEYHAGFRQQVAVWPENPVDAFVELVRQRGAVRGDARKKQTAGKKKMTEGESSDAGEAQEKGDKGKQLKPLPRDFRTHVCTIADLGCGDAKLSATLQPSLRKLKLAIHSFDLAAPSPLVTKADISNLPLAAASVDVAIFCLALMGTNWPDFIDEAYRVLRWKGELWVAEIKSRFGRVGAAASNKVVDHSVGRRQKKGASNKSKQNKQDAAVAQEENAEQDLAVAVDGAAPSSRAKTDVSAFVTALRARGFVLDADSTTTTSSSSSSSSTGGSGSGGVDLSNKMFVRMQFIKAAAPTRGKNVRKDEGARTKTGASAGGTWKAKAKKTAFVEADGAEDEADEAGLLKPCVYKLR